MEKIPSPARRQSDWNLVNPSNRDYAYLNLLLPALPCGTSATIADRYGLVGWGAFQWRSLQPRGDLCSMRASVGVAKQNLPLAPVSPRCMRWELKIRRQTPRGPASEFTVKPRQCRQESGRTRSPPESGNSHSPISIARLVSLIRETPGPSGSARLVQLPRFLCPPCYYFAATT